MSSPMTSSPMTSSPTWIEFWESLLDSWICVTKDIVQGLQMKLVISLQLSLCLQRVTTDSKEEILCTVLLLHQIEGEMNEW